jgi:hypothetical protein
VEPGIPNDSSPHVRGSTRYDLNATIPAASGWRLTAATDISDTGRIVGIGLERGQRRAFRLTLKIPQSTGKSLEVPGGVHLMHLSLIQPRDRRPHL